MSGSVMSVLTTGTLNLNNKGAGPFPVSFGYYPEEGSRAITLQYNWQEQDLYVEDLNQLVTMGVETSIQSAFVDNSRNLYMVLIQVQGSGQVIVVPPNSQGIIPMLFTGTPSMQISSPTPSNGVTGITLLNVPCNAADFWPAAVVPPIGFGLQSRLNMTGSTLVSAVPARLAKISVTAAVVGVGGTVEIDDANALATANAVFILNPTNGLLGSVFDLEWPMAVGIAVNFNGGATGTIAVSFS